MIANFAVAGKAPPAGYILFSSRNGKIIPFSGYCNKFFILLLWEG